jgi:hypothetical protein
MARARTEALGDVEPVHLACDLDLGHACGGELRCRTSSSAVTSVAPHCTLPRGAGAGGEPWRKHCEAPRVRDGIAGAASSGQSHLRRRCWVGNPSERRCMEMAESVLGAARKNSQGVCLPVRLGATPLSRPLGGPLRKRKVPPCKPGGCAVAATTLLGTKTTQRSSGARCGFIRAAPASPTDGDGASPCTPAGRPSVTHARAA